MNTGPSSEEIAQLQQNIILHFAKLKLLPSEVGTCKKVVRLECPELQMSAPTLAVAFTHERNPKAAEIIHHEHQFLRYLKEKGFPVVSLHGEVFCLEQTSLGRRYGMLMDYIPNAVFIEAKTPATLKLLLVAALLGMKTHAREAWVIMHRSYLLQQIQTVLSVPGAFNLNTPERIFSLPEVFEHLNRASRILGENFNNLLLLLEREHLEINDLQMLITQMGHLTIIDPLDVIVFEPASKAFRSLLGSAPLTDEGFHQFLAKTKQWLRNAKHTCLELSEVKNEEGVLAIINSSDKSNVLSFAACDTRNKSRVSHLRQETGAALPRLGASSDSTQRFKPQ